MEITERVPVPLRQVCTQCNEEKHYTEFKKDRRTKTGLAKECKTCSLRQPLGLEYELTSGAA